MAGDVVEKRSGEVTGVVQQDEFFRVRTISTFLFSSTCLQISHLYLACIAITPFFCFPINPNIRLTLLWDSAAQIGRVFDAEVEASGQQLISWPPCWLATSQPACSPLTPGSHPLYLWHHSGNPSQHVVRQKQQIFYAEQSYTKHYKGRDCSRRKIGLIDDGKERERSRIKGISQGRISSVSLLNTYKKGYLYFFLPLDTHQISFSFTIKDNI